MTRPDLSTAEGREAYKAELRAVAAPWRVGGVVVIVVAALWTVIAKGLGRSLSDPMLLGGLGLLAVGWITAIVGILLRGQHHRRRMREPE